MYAQKKLLWTKMNKEVQLQHLGSINKGTIRNVQNDP